MVSPPLTPKRKRVDTETFSSQDSPAADVVGDASPRTYIASKFKNLQLRQSGELDDEAFDDSFDLAELIGPTANKRTRLDQRQVADGEIVETPGASLKSSECSGHVVPYSENVLGSVSPTGRLPARQNESDATPANSSSLIGEAQLQDIADTVSIVEPNPSSNESQSPEKKRKKSPPPTSKHANSSPLVWHDHEITGHLMDDPDDDGVGINGIGFRPTSAIAYARMQKRKQQIAEWKARESREARQRRGERRSKWEDQTRNALRDSDKEADDAKKAVRFAC